MQESSTADGVGTPDSPILSFATPSHPRTVPPTGAGVRACLSSPALRWPCVLAPPASCRAQRHCFHTRLPHRACPPADANGFTRAGRTEGSRPARKVKESQSKGRQAPTSAEGTPHTPPSQKSCPFHPRTTTPTHPAAAAGDRAGVPATETPKDSHSLHPALARIPGTNSPTPTAHPEPRAATCDCPRPPRDRSPAPCPIGRRLIEATAGADRAPVQLARACSGAAMHIYM